jgi:predicted transcriptional regulator
LNANDTKRTLKTKLKILKVLSHTDMFNVSGIARHVGVNYAKASEHLWILETEGVLTHKLLPRESACTSLVKFHSKSGQSGT